MGILQHLRCSENGVGGRVVLCREEYQLSLTFAPPPDCGDAQRQPGRLALRSLRDRRRSVPWQLHQETHNCLVLFHAHPSVHPLVIVLTSSFCTAYNKPVGIFQYTFYLELNHFFMIITDIIKWCCTINTDHVWI